MNISKMSFSLWPSSLSPRSVGIPADGKEKELSTPALDLIAVLHETRFPVLSYRYVADLYSFAKSPFVGAGRNAVVEVAKRSDGTCFAIKRMRQHLEHSDSDIAKYSDRCLAQVTLELRILTLDQLRRHAHLVNVQGICYEESVASPNTVGIGQFHLMLEYSQLGNMASFLQKNGQQLEIEAKIDLVRQVGCGLAILHEFHICHGDLKLQNVLIFDGKDGGYVAKLADFGMSIHSHESEIYYPGGTPLLNAPEIRNRALNEQPVDIAAVIRADIFPFGLLMWGVIKDGQSYFDPLWINSDGPSSPDIGVEEQMAFLSSLPRNGLLLRAEEFLSIQNVDSQLHQQILQVFHATLQDEPLNRQQISDILEIIPVPHGKDRVLFETLREWDTVFPQNHRELGFPTLTDPYTQHELSDYILLDLPYNFQRRALEELKMCATASSALDELDQIRQHAALKVAECYLISFGTEYDPAEVIRWLKIAESYQWRIGLCLDRISEALNYPLEVPRRPESQVIANSEDNEANDSAASESYLMEKILSTVASVVNQIKKLMLRNLLSRHFEIAARSVLSVEIGLTDHSDMTALDIAALLGDNENVTRLVLTNDFSGNRKQQLNAVHHSCIGGNLSTLRLALDRGVNPLAHGTNNVTALHFLIFMPAHVVGSALDLLVAHGVPTDIQSEPIRLADTDLRLVGTPFEWAVIARHRALVHALLPYSKGQESKMLRLAILHAYYEIAADLLSSDAFRNAVTSSDCPVFIVYRPFSHLIVHGRDGDLAIERTIRLCEKYGLINYETKLRESIPLARTQSCLKSIEVLLNLCPPVAIRYGFDTEEVRFDQASIPTLYLAFLCAKADTAWTKILNLMVQHFSVAELNEIKKGGNALHLAVIHDWPVAMQVLLEKGVDVHRRTNMIVPLSSFDLAVRKVDAEGMAMLSEFGGGAGNSLDHNIAHDNPFWWLQNQKAMMRLNFKGVFHENVGDKDAASLSVASNMHTLLRVLLSARDTHFGRGLPDGQSKLLSESIWNDFQVLVSNQSVARCFDIPGDDGVTMLQRAAVFLDIDVVKLFLNVGADANVPFLAKKMGGDENEPVFSFVPFQIACWMGRFVPVMFEKGLIAARFEETNTPPPNQANPKGTKKPHFMHRIGLAMSQTAKRIGARKGDRTPTPGMRAAESFRAKALEVVLEILQWHQLREDPRFEGITELHLCTYMSNRQRAVALVHQGVDTEAKASWPGREGKYTSSELGLLSFTDECEAFRLSLGTIRGKGIYQVPQGATLNTSASTQLQATYQ